jgi:hypothetical protein
MRGELVLGSRKDKAHSSNEMRSTIMSTTGGVMTKEVGAVTGELEVVTRYRVEDIEVTVRYVGAEEWYTVKGSPVELYNARGLPLADLHELHEHVLRHLTTPGKVVEGNEQATSLLGYFSAPSDG